MIPNIVPRRYTIKSVEVWCGQKKLKVILIHIDVDVGVGFVSTNPNSRVLKKNMDVEITIDRFTKTDSLWLNDHFFSDYQIEIKFNADSAVDRCVCDNARLVELNGAGVAQFHADGYRYYTDDKEVEPEKVVFT